MTVKEWKEQFFQHDNGTIKVYDRRSKMYLESGYAGLEVLKVNRHRGHGYNQVNTVLEVLKPSMSEAQKRAQKRYDEANRERWRMINLKLNKDTDADIIEKLESEGSMNGYIKKLIRKDMKESQP